MRGIGIHRKWATAINPCVSHLVSIFASSQLGERGAIRQVLTVARLQLGKRVWETGNVDAGIRSRAMDGRGIDKILKMHEGTDKIGDGGK